MRSARPSEVKAGKISFLRGEEEARLKAASTCQSGPQNNNSSNNYSNNNDGNEKISTPSLSASVNAGAYRRKLGNRNVAPKRQQIQWKRHEQQQQQQEQEQERQEKNDRITGMLSSRNSVSQQQKLSLQSTHLQQYQQLETPKQLKQLKQINKLRQKLQEHEKHQENHAERQQQKQQNFDDIYKIGSTALKQNQNIKLVSKHQQEKQQQQKQNNDSIAGMLPNKKSILQQQHQQQKQSLQTPETPKTPNISKPPKQIKQLKQLKQLKEQHRQHQQHQENQEHQENHNCQQQKQRQPSMDDISISTLSELIQPKQNKKNNNDHDDDGVGMLSPTTSFNRRVAMMSFHDSGQSMASIFSALSEDTDSQWAGDSIGDKNVDMEHEGKDDTTIEEESAEDRKKRDSLIEQIKHLSDHLPERVVKYLMDDIKNNDNDDDDHSTASALSRMSMGSGYISVSSWGSSIKSVSTLKSFVTCNSFRSVRSNATAASFVTSCSGAKMQKLNEMRSDTEKSNDVLSLSNRKLNSLGLMNNANEVLPLANRKQNSLGLINTTEKLNEVSSLASRKHNSLGLAARKHNSLGLNNMTEAETTTEEPTEEATKEATTTEETPEAAAPKRTGRRVMRTFPGGRGGGRGIGVGRGGRGGLLRQSKSAEGRKRGVPRNNSMTNKGVDRQSSFGVFAARSDNRKANALAHGYRKQRRRMKTLTAMRKLAGDLAPNAAGNGRGVRRNDSAHSSISFDSGGSISSGLSDGVRTSQPRQRTKQQQQQQQNGTRDITEGNFSLLLPPAERHDGAMLFVDISGFTKLSVELKVEQLSKTINSYFNMIVEEVLAFGGDVIKFAGDALFAEWQCSPSHSFHDNNDNNDNNNNNNNNNNDCNSALGSGSNMLSWTGLTHEKAALTAAACACQIISKCANYEVFGDDDGTTLNNNNNNSGGHKSQTNGAVGRNKAIDDNRKVRIATLNVHCAIGIGKIVGVHVGSRRDKMEYLILGDPIRQLTNAINVGKMGEVVASPEVFDLIKDDKDNTTDKNNDNNKNDSSSRSNNNNGNATASAAAKTTEPQVILSKTNTFSNRKLLFLRRKKTTKKIMDDPFLLDSKNGWNLLLLQKLYDRMSLYVHPVVVNGSTGGYSRKENFGYKKFQSEAEIRPVFTIFIQPIIPNEIIGSISSSSSDDIDNGNNQKTTTIDVRGLILLNEIMVLVNRELTRFKGQLRQFIVDDKGVVLIANFGLRGSTFPKMVERLAMPFAGSIQPLLQSELGIDTRMGATFGKAYCGVIGGVARHEYAVLGPSVNLAARLMANPKNEGFLVDDECKQKAGSHPFQALPPVKAKGYVNPVHIFEPLIHHRRSWKDVSAHFVGREDELRQIAKLAGDVIDSGTACKMVLVSAESGYGKSALLAHVTEEIQKSCDTRSASHIIVCQITYEDDFFRPLSVIGPLFVDILAISRRNEGDEDLEPCDSSDKLSQFVNALSSKPAAKRSLFQIVGICRSIDVPDDYIETICCLVINHAWPEKLINENNNKVGVTEMHQISRYIVRVILHCTLDFDLIIMAIDDILHTDEMSWMIIQLLFQHSCNMLIIGTTIPNRGKEMNVDRTFWGDLFLSENFVFMDLGPLTQGDIDKLVARYLNEPDLNEEKRVSRKSLSSRAVFAQSGGMPQLAIDILEGKSHDSSNQGNDKGKDGSGYRPSYKRLESIKSCHINEAMLHRMDGLSAAERAHLNLGAIFGSPFDSFDVMLVMERYRGIDDKEKILHAETVHESLKKAVEHGILEKCNEDSHDESIHSLGGGNLALTHPYAGKNVTYRFTHDDWRRNLLTLTLNDWKRDMYRLISEVMEPLLENSRANHKVIVKKLFSHWKETSGDPRDAVALALRIGKTLERNCQGKASLEIYKNAMKLLKGKERKEGSYIDLSDIKLLVKLHITTGRISLKLLDLKTAITEFQAASNLVNESPNCIKNRSIIFPAYCGLFCVLRLAGKRDVQFEEVLAETFVTEANEQSESVHIFRSLAMQAEVLGRHGKFEDAVNRCRYLREIYSTKNDSPCLSEIYEDDHCAQCIGQSALWLERLSLAEEALVVCNEVISNILPNVVPCDSVGVFLTVYPILWVLKDKGFSSKAHDTFQTAVIDAVEGQNPFHVLYTPILTLFDLVTTNGGSARCNEYVKWVMEANNGKHDSQMNIYTGNLGRVADSITAEICLILATNPAVFGWKRMNLVKKGFELAQNSVATLLKSISSDSSSISNDDNGHNNEVRSETLNGTNVKSKIYASSKDEVATDAAKDSYLPIGSETDLAIKGMTCAYYQVKPVYDALGKLMEAI